MGMSRCEASEGGVVGAVGEEDAEGGLLRGGAGGGLWGGGACMLGLDIGDEIGEECAPTTESGAGGSGFL